MPASERSPVELLAGVPVLADLDEHALEELAAGSGERHLRAGELLFDQGDPPDSLAVVIAGRVEVVATSDGTERRVRVVGAGGAVGELSLLTGSPRSAAVRALRDARLLVLERDRFEDAVAAEPALARTLARVLAAQLQREVVYLRSEAAGPRLRPTVLTLVALDRAAPLDALVDRLAPALGLAAGAVGVLRYDAAGGSRELERLDAAEARHEVVVLVVEEPEGRAEWAAFALRSADRIIAVSRGSRLASWRAEPRRTRLEGCDLVVVGPVPSETTSGFREVLRPRATHAVPEHGFGPAADRALRRITGRATGLVLSGGGARGLAHLGVLAELEEAGVTIDRYGGCSMGALVAALAASGRSAAEMIELAREELVRRHPFTDYTVPRASLIKGRRAWEMLHRLFGDRVFEDLPLPTFAVSADLLTGELVVHRRGPVSGGVAASISIPGLAPPLANGQRLLVDGGLLDNLPVDVMQADGEGRVVGVDVMRQLGTPAVMEERSGRRGRRERGEGATSIVDTIARSMTIGGRERVERNRRAADAVLSPDVASIGLLDFERIDDAVDAGRRAASVSLASNYWHR